MSAETQTNKLTIIYGPADDSGPSFHHIKLPTRYLTETGLCQAAWGWQPELMEQADVIVLQRQISDQSLEFVKDKKKKGKAIIYTLGDNLFQLPPHSPVFNYYTPKVQGTAARIMKECHAITTTTPYLAGQLRRHSGQQNIYIVPHLIDKANIDYITPNRPTDTIRIGWTTTPYHVGDWPICSHAIKDICKKYPQVKIIFWGYVNEDMTSFVPREQLEYYGFIPVPNYYECLGAMDIDIGIAPLEDTPYNNSKSPLKYIEYGMLGVPGVYSPREPYDDVVHMETGLKPKKNRYREWYRWLEYLIENPDERERIGKNAREYVLQNHEAHEHVKMYYQIYKEVYDRVQRGWQDINVKPE